MKNYIFIFVNEDINQYQVQLDDFLKAERITREKLQCQFGKSRESRLFIGVVCVGVIAFIIVSILIGHFTINSFKKKYEIESRKSVDKMSSYQMNTDLSSSSMKGILQNPKTPIMPRSSEIYINNKNAFSIPRPSIRIVNNSNT